MSDENKNIPDFLKDSIQQNNETSAKGENFFVSPLKKTFVLISVFWSILVLAYIHFFLGWGGLSALLPGEFIGFLASVFLSLAAISKNNNLLAGMITNALQKQIQELTGAAAQMSQQTSVLKQTLETKAEDFAKISEILNSCFSENLTKLNDSTAQLVAQCQTASETAEKSISQFSAQSEILRNDAKTLVDELNPIINETLATAEHLKNITQESKQTMLQVNENMAGFIEHNQKNLNDLAGIVTNCR